MGMSEVIGVSSGCQGLHLMSPLCGGWCMPNLACRSVGVCGHVLWVPRVIFDVVFVVVCGCCPHNNPSYLWLCASGERVVKGLWASLRLWTCSFVT